MTASCVLIISGPIASGKSTAARTLAADARASGSAAAVVELDRMYMMLDDGPLMSDSAISGLPVSATNLRVASPRVSLRCS